MRTCLVVDDSSVIRKVARRILEGLDFQIIEAEDGEKALEACKRELPDAVLLDWNMPVMDGIDATVALRADPRTRDLPIFALTGDVTPINQRRIGEAGVDGYIEKPVTYEALTRALARLPEWK